MSRLRFVRLDEPDNNHARAAHRNHDIALTQLAEQLLKVRLRNFLALTNAGAVLPGPHPPCTPDQPLPSRQNVFSGSRMISP